MEKLNTIIELHKTFKSNNCLLNLFYVLYYTITLTIFFFEIIGQTENFLVNMYVDITK